MKVEIVGVGSVDTAVQVSFRCSCGSGAGKWIGEVPRLGDEKEVEFDTDEELRLGGNATLAVLQQATIGESVGEVQLTAQLVAKHEDVGTGRFSFDDGRIEVEAADADLSGWEVGNWYTLRLADLVVFDTDI